MSCVVLYNSPGDDPADVAAWRGYLTAYDPAIDFRVWPETGRPEEIDYALAWLPQPGDLERYRNLKAIFWLGAGVDSLLQDPALPRHVPIVRLVDEGLTAGMTEYVLLHVLRYHRRLPETVDFKSYKRDQQKQLLGIIEPIEDLLHLPDGRTLRMVAAPHPFGGVVVTYEDVTDRLALERSHNTLIAVQRETLDHLCEGGALFTATGG